MLLPIGCDPRGWLLSNEIAGAWRQIIIIDDAASVVVVLLFRRRRDPA
jgi:hypothetical protein